VRRSGCSLLRISRDYFTQLLLITNQGVWIRDTDRDLGLLASFEVLV
jgi:hypothetical protein